MTDATVTFPLQIKLDSAPGVTQPGAAVTNKVPQLQALPIWT